MRYLRTNTACRVTVGPFFDKTDGVTPETALTVTSCKLTFMVDDGNVPTLVLDTNPTASGGANDMVHVTGDDAGFYDLELTASNLNYLGRAMLAITDAATHCPVFHEFMILPANVYDAMILGTDLLDASAAQFAGQTITCSGGVTVPAATLASTTNITAGTITTVTNLTNAPTNGDLTSTMKASILTTALTEAYAADGAAGTLAQMLYMIYSCVQEFSISGTTISLKQLDGSTTWGTVTLNSATAPTSRTRAS